MDLAERRSKASRLRAADCTGAINKALNVSGRRVKMVRSIIKKRENVWRTRAHRKKEGNKAVEIIQKSRRSLKPIQENQWRGCRSGEHLAPFPRDRWQEKVTDMKSRAITIKTKIPKQQNTSRICQFQTSTETGGWKAAAIIFVFFSDENSSLWTPYSIARMLNTFFPTEVWGFASGPRTQPESQSLSKIRMLWVIHSDKQKRPPSFTSVNKVINKSRHIEVLPRRWSGVSWPGYVVCMSVRTHFSKTVHLHRDRENLRILEVENYERHDDVVVTLVVVRPASVPWSSSSRRVWRPRTTKSFTGS